MTEYSSRAVVDRECNALAARREGDMLAKYLPRPPTARALQANALSNSSYEWRRPALEFEVVNLKGVKFVGVNWLMPEVAISTGDSHLGHCHVTPKPHQLH
jgi:hypothetical protein